MRHPTDLGEAAFDILAGTDCLEGCGAEKIGLVGHSSGGAAVMQAAALSSTVRTVVTLALQSFGAEAVSKFRPGTSVLAIHGSEDEILSPLASEAIYKMAREPKKMVIYKGAGHVLDEASDEIFK